MADHLFTTFIFLCTSPHYQYKRLYAWRIAIYIFSYIRFSNELFCHYMIGFKRAYASEMFYNLNPLNICACVSVYGTHKSIGDLIGFSMEKWKIHLTTHRLISNIKGIYVK